MFLTPLSILLSCWLLFVPEQDPKAPVRPGDAVDATELSVARSRDELVDTWTKLLIESPYARVDAKVTRRTFKKEIRFDGAEQEIELRKLDFVAETVMSHEAHFAVFWEGEEPRKKYPERPRLIVSYHDGLAEERLWNDDAEVYHHRSWKAPLSLGADGTAYKYGCHVGDLLTTWLGRGSDIVRDVNPNILGVSVLLPERREFAGSSCYVLRRELPPVVDPETGEVLVTVLDDRFFNEDCVQVGRDATIFNTADWNGRNGEPYWINHRVEYDVTFMDEMPEGMKDQLDTRESGTGE